MALYHFIQSLDRWLARIERTLAIALTVALTGIMMAQVVLRYFFNTANGNFEIWLQAKLWGVTTLSVLFTFAQIPMLMKHGLAVEDQTEVEKNPPHD